MYKLPTRHIPYVDIAKGIDILLVVLLHADFVYPNLSYINISGMLGWYWHVPIFFLIVYTLCGMKVKLLLIPFMKRPVL